jgi:peptide/nickel transport system permease protein
MSSDSTVRGFAKEFSKSKSGVIGLILLVVLLVLSAYVLTAIPAQTVIDWNNPKAWERNPGAASPTWVIYLGANVAPTVDLSLSSWAPGPMTSGIRTFTSKATFQWSSGSEPKDLQFYPHSDGTIYQATITWKKPDGNSVQMILSRPESKTSYGLGTPSVQSYVLNYVYVQTKQYQGSISVPQEVSALFNRDGSNLLNNPTLQGNYEVTVQVYTDANAKIYDDTSLSVVGQTYGTMGTDQFGRPIDLGIIVGLPWALELGGVTSVVSVFVGIIFGGIAGFLGGRRDQAMQWVSLVVLALPALPFLIAISYAINLDLLTESILIAALSWPFYAIIARSVSLSIKSQTYVEADKAMGVSSMRTFLSHFLPRLMPVSIAYTALGVPAGILLGETLAFLGIQPENIITWGGMLDTAFSNQAALYGWWWWVVFPGVMIIVASVPFVLVGFALDKIVAPKVGMK